MTVAAEKIPGTGLYKSAVVLVALGAERAAQVLSHLDELQVERLVREMARISHVRPVERDKILEEFGQQMREQAGVALGGMEYARRMLEQAVGPERASEMMDELEGISPHQPTLSSMIESTPPASLAALVADEHPQLIALLAGQLTVGRAADFLSSLPQSLQGPVATRLTEMEAPSPIALQHLERFLLEKLRGSSESVEGVPMAGPRRVADILGSMRRSVETFVLSAVEQQSPAVAAKINRFRFTFENLLELDARSLQRILRELDTETLLLAMKGLDPDRQQVFFSNMSERAAARLREELEDSGPAKLRDVEEAQAAVLSVARALQDKGEIQLRSGEEEEAFV